MVRKSTLSTNQKIALGITIAIIGAVGYFLSGSGFDTIIQERAIIEISFSDNDKLPLEELKLVDNYYEIKITAKNTGGSQTNPNVIVKSENAVISFNKETWSNRESQNLLVRPDGDYRYYTVYVIPDQNFKNFSIQLIPSISIINEVYGIFPLNLEYELEDGNYKFVKGY